MNSKWIPAKGVPLCCDLSALDVTQRKQRSLLDQLLQVGTVDIIELPDGYAFHMDPLSIIVKHLEEFAVLERLCCPFLTIVVRAATSGARPVLEIGGGAAVKEFIAAEFGLRKTTNDNDAIGSSDRRSEWSGHRHGED